MTYTLADLLDIKDGLAYLENKAFESGALSYRIGKILRRVNKEVEDYDRARNRLVTEKYGELCPIPNNPLNYQVKPEHSSAYTEAVIELQAEESDYNFPVIKFEWLKFMKLPPVFFALMGDLIEEPTEEPFAQEEPDNTKTTNNEDLKV